MKRTFIFILFVLISTINFQGKKPKKVHYESCLQKIKEIKVNIPPATEELLMPLFGNNIKMLNDEISKISDDKISGETTIVICRLRKNGNPEDLLVEIQRKKLKPVNLRVLTYLYDKFSLYLPLYSGASSIYTYERKTDRFPVIIKYPKKNEIIHEKIKNMYVKNDLIILMKDATVKKPVKTVKKS